MENIQLYIYITFRITYLFYTQHTLYLVGCGIFIFQYNHEPDKMLESYFFTGIITYMMMNVVHFIILPR